MSDIPSQEPTKFTAGDTVKWTKSLDDYPADLYALKYQIVPLSGGAPLIVSATATGTDYAITISAATSAGYSSGDYRWYSSVTDIATGAERYSINHGDLTIDPDPTAATVADLRSTARQIYDAINATILGEASNAQLKVTVDGDTLENKSTSDLLEMESRYRQLVANEEKAENIRKGLATGDRILTRFS